MPSAATAATSVITTISSVTAAASSILVMSSLAATLGKFHNLFHDLFKHYLPLFIFLNFLYVFLV